MVLVYTVNFTRVSMYAFSGMYVELVIQLVLPLLPDNTGDVASVKGTCVPMKT